MKSQAFKNNIISWYPFEPNSTILEIKDDLKKIGEEQYDYILLTGILEYAYKLFEGDNPEHQLIEYAMKHLKEDGKILLAVDNKIGIRTFCEEQQNKKDMHRLNRRQVEKLLELSGFKYYKFYYPLPDYETANVVFTDEFLPNQETISRNISLHEKEDILFQPENKLFLDLLEQDKDLFKLFTNSYFIECSRQEFADNQIKFVSFSNMRKNKYRIKTIIQGDTVYKLAANEQAKVHIENIKNNIEILKKLRFRTLDSYKEDVILSKYQKNRESLDNIIINKIKENKKEEALQLITRFFNEIKEKLSNVKTEKNIFNEYKISYEIEKIENLTFTKYGLWDLIFQNAFCIDEQFFFYDQEWIEEGIPIEYIFYRSIEYTRGLKELIEVENVFEQFGITKQHLELFVQLDNKLQEETRSDEIWNMHVKQPIVEEMRLEMQSKLKQSQDEKERILKESIDLLNQKDARICFLEENMDRTVKLLQQKENQVVQMENSIIWKATKPLRNLNRKGEKNEN